jgi:hypothetical protein
MEMLRRTDGDEKPAGILRTSVTALRAMASVHLLYPPARPISECENPKRNQIDQWDEHHDRPQWRESDPAKNTANRIDYRRYHHDEPEPMGGTKPVSVHPAIHHLPSPVRICLAILTKLRADLLM